VHRGHDIVACRVIVVSVPAAADVLWLAMWWITWCCGAATRVGGELCLRKVYALDGRRERVLLGAQVARGLLKRRHL
jgi:hypothetical protein